jgi:hypothetical protein
MDKVFKKIIIDAFEDPLLNALSDMTVGYANRKSLDFITHHLTYCAMIVHTEITQNCERLNTHYDPNHPIKTLIQKIKAA